MKQSLILLVCTIIFGCTHLPTERSISSLSPTEIDQLWVSSVGQHRDSMIRSNPQHFWAWMSANAPAQLSSLVVHQGEVTGDPHFFNFADIHLANGSNGLALVDVDDSGQGSWMIDFIRYQLFIKAYVGQEHKKLDQKQLATAMYQAYVNGLAQKKMEMPLAIKKVVQRSRTELDTANALWVHKHLQAGTQMLDKVKLGLTDMSNVSTERKVLAENLKQTLLKNGRLKKIFDVGFISNDSGSSRDLNRFWFSAINDFGTDRIVECKALTKPSAEYFKPQEPASLRIPKVLKYYSDFQTTDVYVTDVKKDSYWCRARRLDFITRDTIDTLNKADMAEVSVFYANWLGSKQGLQPGAKEYFDALKANTKTFEQMQQLLKDYETRIDQLSGFTR